MTSEEEARMAQETQGKTMSSIINQQQNTGKLLRIMTGYGQHASQKTISFPEYRPYWKYSRHSNRHEEEQQERLHNQLYQKGTIVPKQTRKP